MEHVHFVDTTIRDGHQSLWAERMSTGMMLPIAKNLNEARLLKRSSCSPARTSRRPCASCARIRGSASGASPSAVPNTPMRLIAGRVNTFALRSALHVRDCSSAAWPRTGIRQARISEPVERSAGLDLPREGRAPVRGRSDRQPDLLGLARSHRRILRRSAAGRR